MNLSANNRSVLISPLGASKGLLFSALSLIKPDFCLVLTSKEYAGIAEEVFKITGQTEKKILPMNDVYTGFAETDYLLQATSEQICCNDSIIINLTGGTTAMQWVMQAIFEMLKGQKVNVRRVAFIDRRNALQQQKNPFVIGEIFEIDKKIELR